MAPILIVFAGPPGTGKSTPAKEVAQGLGAPWLRIDAAEAAMLKPDLAKSFETGLAAYIVAQDLAADQLRLGKAVVVDTVNGVEAARTMWRDLSGACAASLFVVETICSDRAEHQRRVEGREEQTPPLPAATWRDVVEREYQTWNEPRLTIDTIQPVDQCLARILEHLSRGVTPA